MQRALSPRSGNVCSENKGIMCVCWNRANERCSSWSPGMIFKTTSRSASAGSTARYVLPEAPWPSSERRRNGPSCSPTSGKSVARERGHSKRSQLSSSSSSSFHWGNRVMTSAVTTCSPASRRRQTSSYTSRTAFSVLNSGYCFKSSSTVICSPRPGGSHRPDLARDPLALRPAATH